MLKKVYYRWKYEIDEDRWKKRLTLPNFFYYALNWNNK